MVSPVSQALAHVIKNLWDVKEPTHSSKRVGHVVPSVVVYLTFTPMYGGIITHSFHYL